MTERERLVIVTAVQDMEIKRYLDEHRGETLDEELPRVKWWIPLPSVEVPYEDAIGVGLTRALREYERRLMQRALEQVPTVKGAARELKIHRQRLINGIQKYGLKTAGARRGAPLKSVCPSN